MRQDPFLGSPSVGKGVFLNPSFGSRCFQAPRSLHSCYRLFLSNRDVCYQVNLKQPQSQKEPNYKLAICKFMGFLINT